MGPQTCSYCGTVVESLANGICPSCSKFLDESDIGRIAAASSSQNENVIISEVELARRQLFWPAMGLLILAPLGVLLDIASMAISISNGDPAAVIFSMLPFALIHCLIFYGAICMLKLRSYSTARAVAIVACVPVCSPLGWLGGPFGIWALTLLHLAHVERAFEKSNDTSVNASAQIRIRADCVTERTQTIYSGRPCLLRSGQRTGNVVLTLMGVSQVRAGESALVTLRFPNLQDIDVWLAAGASFELLDEDERPFGDGTVTQVHV